MTKYTVIIMNEDSAQYFLFSKYVESFEEFRKLIENFIKENVTNEMDEEDAREELIEFDYKTEREVPLILFESLSSGIYWCSMVPQKETGLFTLVEETTPTDGDWRTFNMEVVSNSSDINSINDFNQYILSKIEDKKNYDSSVPYFNFNDFSDCSEAILLVENVKDKWDGIFNNDLWKTNS